MKKITALLLISVMIFALCSCSGKAPQKATNTDATATDAREVETKSTLDIEREAVPNAAVIYFSHNDVIKEAAEFAAGVRGCDLIEIVPKEAYPDDATELAQRIKEEKENNVRPALKDQPKNLDDYDILFVGFPVWENTMPMPLYTFLEDYDMMNKAIIPFCYSPDGKFGESLNDMAELCRYGAIVSCHTLTDGDFEPEKPIFEGWMDQVLFS